MIPYKRFKADRKAHDSVLTVGGTILAVCLLIVAAIAIAENWEVSAESVDQAEMGSFVSVSYVGSYSNEWVFETNIHSVAVDPDVIKAFEFSSSTGPLQFKIGSSTLLPGFQNAVIGMRPNETISVTLSASEAYGLVPAGKLQNFSINRTVAVTETMSASEFLNFYGENASVGLTVSHPEFGWMVSVLHIDDDMLTIQNLPIVGEQYAAYGNPSDSSPTGWFIKVTSKNANDITFTNLLSSSMVNKIKGVDASGSIFYLHAVDDTSFSLKQTNELVGRPITFTITLVDIL